VSCHEVSSMALKFFQIPARGCDETETALNGHMRSHRVLSVERRWVDVGHESFWAICVDSLDQQGESGGTGGGRRNRVDYREVLSPEDFTKFASLREIRKQISQEDGIPVYAIMTNEQIAQVVTRGVSDRAGLKEIPGLGDAKVERFGSRILERLEELKDPDDATNRESV